MSKEKNKKKVLDFETAIKLCNTECPADLYEAQTVANEYRRIKNNQALLIVEKNEAVREAQEEYNSKIEIHEGLLDRLRRRLKLFSMRYRGDLFEGKQSYVCNGVALKFRQSSGKVVTTHGKKEADIVDDLLALPDPTMARECLEFTPALNKTAIKRLVEASPEWAEKLESIGLVVQYDETFNATVISDEEVLNTATA